MLAAQRKDYFFAELVLDLIPILTSQQPKGFLPCSWRCEPDLRILAMLREKAACQAAKPSARPHLAEQ